MERLNKREFFQNTLKPWFEENKRNFPWRENPTPYVVWISEVMLQQTQASVVIPYFMKWMARFPTIETLAAAPLEEIIKMWEGLGYYSRARNLHEGAKIIVEKYRGEIPNTPEELKQVKGIGPYTLGAILSFAFHQKAPAVDGNVLRVMSRFFALEEEITLPKVQNKIRTKVLEILPDKSPWVVMEGLIELGALVCTKKPKCAECPIKEECLALRRGKEESLPKKKKPPGQIFLKREVALIVYQGKILIQKHQKKKLMADLYEFPYFENGESIADFYKGSLNEYGQLNPVNHSFTRYQAELYSKIWVAKEKKEVEGYEWIEGDRLSEYPFSSGHRRILEQFLEAYAHITY